MAKKDKSFREERDKVDRRPIAGVNKDESAGPGRLFKNDRSSVFLLFFKSDLAWDIRVRVLFFIVNLRIRIQAL